MNISHLQRALNAIKRDVYNAVTTSSYGGNQYTDGLAAKTALIRSATLIQRIHEVTKEGLNDELKRRNMPCTIHPPVGSSSPEISVWGLLKKKKQDVVVLVKSTQSTREKITEGPLAGQFDELGTAATKSAIVVGVRSQLSSVDKNFDTLMERAFAETMNLRLRHPYLVMAEVYVLAVRNYDEQAMKNNQIAWKEKFNNVERFISMFNGISHRSNYQNLKDSYKYERSALILVDFSQQKPKIYTTKNELQKDNIISQSFAEDYTCLSPLKFEEDLIDQYQNRHT